VVLLIARAGGVSTNSSWEYQNDGRESGAWIFFCCTQDIGEFRPALVPLHFRTDNRRERERWTIEVRRGVDRGVLTRVLQSFYFASCVSKLPL
jgi:hypothetical protein